MKDAAVNKIPFLFLAVLGLYIVGIIAELPLLLFALKPLLMPVLMWWLFAAKGISGKPNKIIFAGLFFSFLGDTLLLFETKDPLFFIFGLVFFLATHLCYIIFFLGIPFNGASLLRKQPLLFLLVLAYGIGLIWKLFPGLGALKYPVIIYAIFICTMLLASLHVYFKVNKPSRYFYIAGAVLFVASDSLLALNKFYQTFPFAAILIMVTYCAAQLFIVKGFIDQQ